MSDESLPVVQQLLPQVDVEGFYIGSDGSETCALHAAAFHGAIQVLEFLCQDIHASADASQDGGCCDINRQDSNGWTALHFCAGSNSVAAVQVLAKYGANWDLEAGNGYTPLQWAVRLQHHAVADELRRLAEEKARRRRRPRWIMARQPLAAIAKRFLAMMPMHSSSPSSFLHPVQPIRE
jgi:ankyrin repeat protein